MNPEVAALLEELAADTEAASVTFFPMGFHTHLMADGYGGWNLEVHTNRQSEEEDDEEQVLEHHENLTTGELVFKMSIFAMIAEVYLDEVSATFADEVEAFLASNVEE